jgi:hypothetical protein
MVVDSEGRVTRPETAEPPRSAREGTVTLGLVAAPDIPEKIAHELAAGLPGLLNRRMDDRVSWEVPVVVDPLTGSVRDAPELLDACRRRRIEEDWDLALCLTDLPVYRSGSVVVADLSVGRRVAGLSLPALGTAQLRRRTREVILQLSGELYARSQQSGGEDPAEGAQSRERHHPDDELWAELPGPYWRIEPADRDMKEMDVDARFSAPGVRGHVRLLSGMALANRPWNLFPSFKGTLAAAFATGAYALVITTLWILADSVGWPRLLLLMVTAIVAMVVWIIVAHHLWERPEDHQKRKWVALYNGVTVLTICVAVLFAYAVLFALIFVAAWVFVPGAYFQTILKHPVGFGEYLTLSWLAASLATIAGALGSSLEDEDTVRNAAYGYRQRRRNQSQDDSEDG